MCVVQIQDKLFKYKQVHVNCSLTRKSIAAVYNGYCGE